MVSGENKQAVWEKKLKTGKILKFFSLSKNSQEQGKYGAGIEIYNIPCSTLPMACGNNKYRHDCYDFNIEINFCTMLHQLNSSMYNLQKFDFSS